MKTTTGFVMSCALVLTFGVAWAQTAPTTGNATEHATTGTQPDPPPPKKHPHQGTYGNPGMATPCTLMNGTPGTRTASGGCRSSTNKKKNGYPPSDLDAGTATPSTQQPQ